MSRSGYTDDTDDQWQLIRWRGAVASAIRGKCGQAFLREMLAALDALPDKVLVANSFIEPEGGCVCALGAVGKARGMDLAAEFGDYDPDDGGDLDQVHVANAFGIPYSLACEIMWENDEGPHAETPEQRFARVRRWVERRLIEWEPPA